MIIMTGKVLIARSGPPREEPRREELGRYTEHIQRTEVIMRTCAR